MHKIYSRPRLKIPKVVIHMKNNKERSGKRAKILIIVVIAFMTLAFIISAVTPIFDTLCKNEAISIATIIANNKATEVMAKHTYDELFSIEKDESGNIKMIKSNVIPINDPERDPEPCGPCRKLQGPAGGREEVNPAPRKRAPRRSLFCNSFVTTFPQRHVIM